MVEYDIQQFAGGPGPPGRKRSQEHSVKVAQATYLTATGAKVSTRSQAYSQAVSHGVCLMFSVLCF